MLQFKAVMRKNYLLKRRNLRMTLTETAMPLFWLFILIVVKFTSKPAGMNPAETHKPWPVAGRLELTCPSLNSTCVFAYAPNNSADVTAVMSIIQNSFIFNHSEVRGYATENEIVSAYTKEPGVIQGAYIFESGNLFNCTIRLNDSVLSMQDTEERYSSANFPAWQLALQKAIVSYKLKRNAQITYSSKRFPDPPYIQPSAPGLIWPFYFPIMFGYGFGNTLSYLVTEKEKKTKDMMRMMGCTATVYWLSWFVTQALTNVLQTSIITIIVFALKIITFSSFVSVFLTLLGYALSLTTLGFFLSVFFQMPRAAMALSWLMLLAMLAASALGHFLVYEHVSWLRWAFCIFPTTPLMENAFQWGNAESHKEKLGTFREHQGTRILLLLFDAVLFALLAAYAEIVWNEGQRVFFFLRPSFWRGGRIDDVGKRRDARSQESAYLLANSSAADALELIDLTKIYTVAGKDVTVVNNLSLTIGRGEIFALLGHNGAGKSTTIAMLTGAVAPSRGDALLMGRSVLSEMHQIRQFIGVCPQHDVLFDDLTAEEHLQLFSELKNRVYERDTVTRLFADVGLEPANYTQFPKDFSGGMKRKLSTAMALVADSPVVFLDECTAGMDPYSRKKIWSLLQRYKQDRIIILTTHFMEEADLLGDRIGIMKHGRMQCIGTSLELKNRFGLGYKLTFVRADSSAASAAASSAALDQFLKEHFTREPCTLLHSGGVEVTYQLPRTARPQFPKFFGDLDQAMGRLGVSSYGLSMTTLEEVFLKLATEPDANES